MPILNSHQPLLVDMPNSMLMCGSFSFSISKQSTYLTKPIETWSKISAKNNQLNKIHTQKMFMFLTSVPQHLLVF